MKAIKCVLASVAVIMVTGSLHTVQAHQGLQASQVLNIHGDLKKSQER